MPDDKFESWATQEILRLRTEADALERALQMYHTSHARSSTVPKNQENRGGSPKTTRAKSRRKGSKTQTIVTFVRETGDHGAALADVYKLVEEKNLRMQKSSVRSVLYLEKKKGHLVERDGRYFFAANGLERGSPSPSTVSQPGLAIQ